MLNFNEIFLTGNIPRFFLHYFKLILRSYSFPVLDLLFYFLLSFTTSCAKLKFIVAWHNFLGLVSLVRNTNPIWNIKWLYFLLKRIKIINFQKQQKLLKFLRILSLLAFKFRTIYKKTNLNQNRHKLLKIHLLIKLRILLKNLHQILPTHIIQLNNPKLLTKNHKFVYSHNLCFLLDLFECWVITCSITHPTIMLEYCVEVFGVVFCDGVFRGCRILWVVFDVLGELVILGLLGLGFCFVRVEVGLLVLLLLFWLGFSFRTVLNALL